MCLVENSYSHSRHKLLAVLKSVLCVQGQTMSMLQIPLMAFARLPLFKPSLTHTTVSSWLIKTLGVAATAVTQLFGRDIPLISQRCLVQRTMLCSLQRLLCPDQFYVHGSARDENLIQSEQNWADEILLHCVWTVLAELK